MKHKFSNLEKKMKETTTKHLTERDELIKAMTKIEHKEAQYRHEIKNKELQVTKLQEQLKAAGDADAVVAIAKAAGFVISADALKKSQTTPVSEEELEGVTGRGALKADVNSGCKLCWGT